MSSGLFYIGVTHETAPLSIRENIHPDADKQRTMLRRLSALADGRMTLSTCERFEIYATTDRPDAKTWAAVLARWFHLPAKLLADHVRVRRGAEVAEHLLRVAGGLESRIVGEPQILGQVRRAFLQAHESGSLNPVLHALGRTAIHAGKRIRHETSIAGGGRNIATIALDHVARASVDPRFDGDPIRGRTFLVLGSGNLAEVVAAELVLRRAGRLTIAARNADRAVGLAEKFQATSLSIDRLPAAVAEADVVVACTSSPAFLIDAAVIGSRRNRPLHLIDLSAPRNVDPDVSRLANVRLTHLENLVGHDAESDPALFSAERIMRDELDRFLKWRRERSVAPRIAAMMDRLGRLEAMPRRIDKSRLHARIMRWKERAA